MSLHWYDFAGFVGVILMVLAFFLQQSGRVRGDGLPNQLLNALGALGVLLSLLFGAFNLSAFLLESVWLTISVYGMVRGARRRSRRAASPRSES